MTRMRNNINLFTEKLRDFRLYEIFRVLGRVMGFGIMLLNRDAAVKQAATTDSRKIKLALEDLKEPVPGVITTWKKPYSKWDPNNVESHEAFRREQVVMGMVKDGAVVFGNDADRQRLKKAAEGTKGR